MSKPSRPRARNDLARSHCHDIIEKYPDTKAAKEAKEFLEKLKD